MTTWRHAGIEEYLKNRRTRELNKLVSVVCMCGP